MINPIFDIENWKEIGATLARNKTRTFLTAFGIFWGTAMLAMLWGGAHGLEGMLMSNFEGFATNMAFVESQRTSIPYKGYNKGLAWSLTINDVANIRRSVPHIEASSAVSGAGNMTVVNGQHHSSGSVIGVDASYTRIFLPIIYEGRFINEADESNERKVCVLGKRIATELFGVESPIGKFVDVNGIFYRVIGVAGQTAEVQIMSKVDDSVIVPMSTLRRAYNFGENVDALLILAEQGYKPKDLEPAIGRAIRLSHPIHPDDSKAIGFFDISEQFAMIDNLFIGINVLALFVGIGTLLAGIIGVGNIMWVIVRERTQEIGIRRAIGAKPRDIIVQILSESVVLTTVAGIAGICFAVGVLAVAEMMTKTPTSSPEFQLTLTQAVVIMVTFMVLGTAAGTIPAIKAMRIKPVEAMNDK
ncbi:MAG: ABC transporter permease [Pseudoflavonifractor sp.]|nr:ABC transporter permease [Pseudoflavonifractor sp.]